MSDRASGDGSATSGDAGSWAMGPAPPPPPPPPPPRDPSAVRAARFSEFARSRARDADSDDADRGGCSWWPPPVAEGAAVAPAQPPASDRKPRPARLFRREARTVSAARSRGVADDVSS